MDLTYRPRRMRRTSALRSMVREHSLSAADFIYPLFVHEGPDIQPINAMPGANRWSLDTLIGEVQRAWELGIRCVVLFPKVNEALKTEDAKECFNEKGLIPEAIRRLKKEIPEMTVMTDVALDPYSCDGHDGLVNEKGEVDNDATLPLLAQMAQLAGEAGADVVAPSDMMDGRVGYIRQELDRAGLSHVLILSYAAKYASAFYGPFRETLHSTPKFGDKKGYQLNPANSREALLECQLDEKEGADLLLIKPAITCLDIICKAKAMTSLPIGAYQVSGEYSMIMAAGQNGWLNAEETLVESLVAIKRAGADFILTYGAKTYAKKWRQFHQL